MSIPKKGNAQNVQTITVTFFSHGSRVMFKILQVRLQQYVNCGLPDVQIGFRKSRRTRNQIANKVGSLKKQESSRKTSTSALLTTLDYTKAFDCVDHSKLWKILKEMGIPDHLTCLLRNLYAGQEQQLELEVQQQTSFK